MKDDNQPKVRVGKEAEDLDFMLDQVAAGDLWLALCFTVSNSHAGNLIRAAIDTIQAARHVIREAARADTLKDQVDLVEVLLANRRGDL